MHFTYQPNLSNDKLFQGDVLKRTVDINSMLQAVHPHFYQHPKNLFFMVLTQSCDLVMGRAGEFCKSPYIAIVPVRPFEWVLERQIEQLRTLDIESELPVLTDKAKTKLSEFLTRLYNNNEPGYFFLEAKGTGLPHDCCAFLNLSISIRSNAHFQKCLDAKILELEPSFQAKLGWLVGQQYSRVGTEDWTKSELTLKVRAALNDAAIWIQDSKLASVQHAYTELIRIAPGSQLSAKQIEDALKNAPTQKSVVLDQVNKIITDTLGPNSAPIAEKIYRRLISDPALTAALKR